MKIIFKLFFLVNVMFALPAFAACEYPSKVNIPNGATSTTEEFMSGYQAVRKWVDDMNMYLECIDQDTISMISMLKINQQHTPEAEATIVEHQDKKYNAAVEDQQKVAELLNIQVRAYKAAQE
jgi:hypothetical protein